MPALAYSIEEKKKPRFLREKAVELGVPVGPAFGKLHNGQEVEIDGKIIKPEQVLGPPRKGIKITYSGDTQPCEEMIMFARDSTLLIHESTFIQKEAQNAMDYGHSTSQDAAYVARESNSKELILTHISTRYGEEYAQIMLKEARELFENTRIAEDYMEIPVRAIREYIKNALDIIVTTSRLSDGRRKVTSISEIIGMKDGEIELREIFSFHQNGVTSNNEVDGYFVKCNGIPKVL